MDVPSFDPKEFAAKRNQAKKRELLELIESNSYEALSSEQVWGFEVFIDVAGGIGYLKLTYECTFDSGPKLYCEARIGGAGSSVIGAWRGRGEMNVSPDSLKGTESDLQIVLTPFALETTFWAVPSKYQGVAGAGGIALAGLVGGGRGIWTQR